jgi:hypothetical protein
MNVVLFGGIKCVHHILVGQQASVGQIVHVKVAVDKVNLNNDGGGEINTKKIMLYLNLDKFKINEWDA